MFWLLLMFPHFSHVFHLQRWLIAHQKYHFPTSMYAFIHSVYQCTDVYFSSFFLFDFKSYIIYSPWVPTIKRYNIINDVFVWSLTANGMPCICLGSKFCAQVSDNKHSDMQLQMCWYCDATFYLRNFALFMCARYNLSLKLRIKNERINYRYTLFTLYTK